MTSVDIDIDEHLNTIDSFLDSAEQNQEGLVMFEAPHSIYVEYPTEYNTKPPLDPLLDWVKRNIATENPKDTAFAIQNHIYENGTEGIFFMNRTKENFEQTKAGNIINNYDGPIEDAPKNIMEEILQAILDDATEIIDEENKVDTGKLIESGIYELGKGDLVQ